MSSLVETKPGQSSQPPNSARNTAISMRLSYKQVESMVASSTSPRRPKKVRPSESDESDLDLELAAWEEASDEASEGIDEAFSE